MKKSLRGSFTVESSFIIPIFVFIIMALIASGFYVRNVILIKAAAWKEGIRLEHMTGSRSAADNQINAYEDLKSEIRENAVFFRDMNVSLSTSQNSDTTIRVQGTSGFPVPLFGSLGAIDITEKIKTNNPAAQLRKWHGLQMIMNNKRGK